MERECVKLVTELLTLPLETLGLRILEIENFAPVMNILGMHCALVLPTHRAQCAHPVTSLYRRNAACDLKLIAYVFVSIAGVQNSTLARQWLCVSSRPS